MYFVNFSEEIVKRCQTTSCLIDAKSGCIYTDIGDKIAQCGSNFISRGLEPGDRIIIVCTLSPPTAIAYLGALYAGLVAVMIDATTLGEISAYIDATNARAVWSENNIPTLENRPEIIHVHNIPSSDNSCHYPPVVRAQNDLAALMPTSGTTGKPRFVMVSHGNLLANTEAIVRSQHLGDGESAMLILPLSYCFGTSILHSHLYCGGSVVFDSRFMFPDKVLRSIAEHGCTTFAGVPSVYKILVTRSSLSSIPVPSLKRAIQAGGHLEWAYVEKFTSIVPDVPFYVMYGQTEATARISCLNPAMLSKKKGSIGLPLDNLKIRIVDASGTVLPSQTSGTIQVRGPSVCSGYWKDPEATRTRFIDGWLHTNDFGRIDDDGFLWIEGRNEDFLKVRGKRLSYGEIEQKVLSINGVLETASCSIPHEEAGEAPAIFLVAEENMLPDELLGRIKASLPVAWTCDKILVVDQIPLTERGKLDRGKLRELLGAHEYS